MNYYTMRLAIEQFSIGNINYYEQVVEAMAPRDKELVENYLHLRFNGTKQNEVTSLDYYRETD